MNTGIKVLLAVLVLALALDLALIVHQDGRANPNGRGTAEAEGALTGGTAGSQSVRSDGTGVGFHITSSDTEEDSSFTDASDTLAPEDGAEAVD